MPEYLLLSYQDYDAGPSTPEDWADAKARWDGYLQDMKDAGVFVGNRGLDRPEVATTVRVRDGETQLTDGPFADSKEYLASYFLIETADLDAAVEWAARMPSSTDGAVEIRPVWGTAKQTAGAGEDQTWS